MTKRPTSAIFAALASILGLSACGGSDSTSFTTEPLVGLASLTDTNSKLQTLTILDAEQRGSALTIDFDGYDYVASDGFDGGRAVEDGAAVGLLIREDLPTDADISLFAGSYNDGSENVSVFYGLLGDEPADVPLSGSGSWSGTGFSQIITDAGTEDLGLGVVSVNAVFGGTVSADITSLGGTIDEINLTGLTITDGQFGGTSIETRKNGSLIDVAGPGAIGDAQGFFSGDTVGGIPDEVGGLFTLTGPDATVVGGFVAD